MCERIKASILDYPYINLPGVEYVVSQVFIQISKFMHFRYVKMLLHFTEKQNSYIIIAFRFAFALHKRMKQLTCYT